MDEARTVKRRAALPWRDVVCRHYSRPDDLLLNVYQDPNCGCWLWLGASDYKGYGFIQCCHRRVRLPRLILMLLGHDMAGRQALHKCDTPPRLNPDHLYPGTTRDNSRDAAERGRLFRQGSALPRGIVKTPDLLRPYRATLWDGDASKKVHVGHFATLEAAVAARAAAIEARKEGR